jgi:acyl-coenzyme A thioesterase PaaI-like protein
MTDDKHYQPNSHYCFVCGLKNKAGLRIRFQDDGIGRVKVETQICDQHQGYPGVAHGGIVASLMDEVMGRAMIAGYPNRLFYTAKLEIRYRKPVPLNAPLLAYGRILKDRGRSATTEGELILPDGTVAITGTATLFAVPQEELSKMTSELDLGWRVYSDEEAAQVELVELGHCHE